MISHDFNHMLSFPGSATYYSTPPPTRPVTLLPVALILCLAMALFAFVNASEWEGVAMLHLLFWISCSVGVGALLRRNAHLFVDYPKFVKA